MTFVVPNLERVTDSDLKLALDDLKRRHIALAIGTGMIVRSDRCRVRPHIVLFDTIELAQDWERIKGTASKGASGRNPWNDVLEAVA